MSPAVLAAIAIPCFPLALGLVDRVLGLVALLRAKQDDIPAVAKALGRWLR